LYISARGEERLHATAEEIRQATGANVTPIVADHSSEEGREKILSVCPDPDILVGTCSPAPFTPDFREVTVAQWEEHLATGLISPIEFIRATVDGNGRFVTGNIVSMRQLRPDGPRRDAADRAGRMMRELTVLDFAGGGLNFDSAGAFQPAAGPVADCEAAP